MRYIHCNLRPPSSASDHGTVGVSGVNEYLCRMVSVSNFVHGLSDLLLGRSPPSPDDPVPAVSDTAETPDVAVTVLLPVAASVRWMEP
jgi:hypothetical protein